MIILRQKKYATPATTVYKKDGFTTFNTPMKGGGVYKTVVRPDGSMCSSINGMLIGQPAATTGKLRPRMGGRAGMSLSTGI